jgi:acetyl-CoA carboxylase biotin carboxyl carrier protein
MTESLHRLTEVTDTFDRDGSASLRSRLDLARSGAVLLLAELPGPLFRVRVAVGEVCVEMEWHPHAVAPPAADDSLADRHPIVPASPSGPAAARADDAYEVRAPAVGVFYHAPSPGAPAFVDVGDSVVAGQQLGIIEVMKLMIPVSADRNGRIVEISADDASAVEFDQRLFLVDVSGH